MQGHCAICGTKGTNGNILTQHHHFWQKNDIYRRFGAELFREMRTYIQWVCHNCHTEYNDYYLHQCHQYGCKECKFKVICLEGSGLLEPFIARLEAMK